MADRYTLATSATVTTDRLVALGKAATHLSDGTCVFLWRDDAAVNSPLVLSYTADRDTVVEIFRWPTSGFGGTFMTGGNSMQRVALCRDSSDNIFVVGVAPTSQTSGVLQRFAKGAGLTWTAGTAVTFTVVGVILEAVSAVWCNTGGAGVVVAVWSTDTPAYAYSTTSAGATPAALQAGSASAFMGTPPPLVSQGQPIEVEPDGFGAVSGATLAPTTSAVQVGRWTVNGSGVLSGTGLVATTVPTRNFSFTDKARLVRLSADRYVALCPDTANVIQAALYSSTARLVAPTKPGAVPGFPTPGDDYGWDVYLDPITPDTIWLLAVSTSSGQTMLRLKLDTSAGALAWAATAVVDDTNIGTVGSTSLGSLRAVKKPVAPGSDYHVSASTAGTVELLGDFSAVDVPPSAPSLTAPVNNAYIDLAGGYTFTWTFIDPLGDTQSAYYLRRKLTPSGSAQWWTGTAWSSTETAVASALGQAVIPAGSWGPNGGAWNIAVATKDSRGNRGPYTAVVTVVASTPPTATATGPVGTVTTSNRPPGAWSYSDAEGTPQATYQGKFFTAAQYGAGGFNPSTSTAAWDSGEQVGTSVRSVTPTVDLTNSTVYRFYVRVSHAGNQYSAWSFSDFNVSLTPPGAPVSTTATADTVNGRIAVSSAAAGGSPAATLQRVEYRDSDDTVWHVLVDGVAFGTVYDRFPRSGVARSYRFTGLAAVGGSTIASTPSASVTATLVRTNWWSVHPTDTSFDFVWLNTADTIEVQDDTPQATFSPIGRTRNVVVSDVSHGDSGDLHMGFMDRATFAKFETQRQLGTPIAVLSPYGDLRWVVYGSRKMSQWSNPQHVFKAEVTVGFTEVDAPI